jgi:hypothetical protein
LQALEQLADELGPTKLLVLEYHTNDAYTVPGIQPLLLSYGVTGTPTVMFDGGNASIGSDSVVQNEYQRYNYKITADLAVRNPLTIEAGTDLGGDSLLVNVTLNNPSNQTITGAQLIGVAYVDQGKSQYRAIVSEISSVGNPVNLSPGDTLHVQLAFKKPASVEKVAVFLKSSGHIIQATLAS